MSASAPGFRCHAGVRFWAFRSVLSIPRNATAHSGTACEDAEVAEVSEKWCVVAPYLKALRWSIGSLAPIPSLSDQLPFPCHFAASRGHDPKGGRYVTRTGAASPPTPGAAEEAPHGAREARR